MKDVSELSFPQNVKYAEDHEWISAAAPHRVGISDYAQDALGDLTFVEVPEVGAEVTKGEEFGTLESTKSVSPLLSPVDGKVTAINEALADDPGLVNRDPYGEGWIMEVEPKDGGQVAALLDVAAYKAHVEKEAAGH